MGVDPARRNQSLYCIYHREKARHLKEFLEGQGGGNAGQGLGG